MGLLSRLSNRVFGKAARPAPKPVLRPARAPVAKRPPVDADGVTHHLVLYKFDSCPYCRRVMRTLDDLGLDIAYADIRESTEARDTLLERTGRTTVPCLFIDDEPLFESADIMAYLNRTYPPPQA